MHCFGHIHEAWGAEIVRWKTDGGDAAKDGGGGRFGEEGEVLGSIVPGMRGVQRPDDGDAVERRANYLDVSREGSRPLKVGEEKRDSKEGRI